MVALWSFPLHLFEQTTLALSYSKQVPVLLAAAIINLRLVTLNALTLQENYEGQLAAAGLYCKQAEAILFDVNVFMLASSLSAVRRDNCLRGLFLLNSICVIPRVRQMVATAISFGLLKIYFMQRFRISRCSFP